MKRNKLSAASSFCVLRKRYRWTCMALMLLAYPVCSANAQSKDRDNPTPLTSNVISGTIAPDNKGDNYHYSFVAGPGEVTITLTVESGSRVNQVKYDLFDEDAKRIAGKFATAGGGGNDQSVEHITVNRRQTVLLRITMNYSFGSGRYRVRIGGAVDFSQGSANDPIQGIDPVAAAAFRNNTDNPECLPKKGILRVRMKDGSIRRIDLSEAEEITIEH